MIRFWLGCACGLWLLACTDATTNVVSDQLPAKADAGSGGAGHAGTHAGDAATGDAAPGDGGTSRARCHDALCACDDGIDNDGDGLTDGRDPECTGAFDDDETSFGTGTPRSVGLCRDCFWDDNGGRGDDQCAYPRECLQGVTPKGNRGACSSCEPSSACVSACASRTPNGCDCFGCCQITRNDGSHVEVVLEDGCSLDKVDDPKACPLCIRNTTCINPCGRCELCPGKSASDLPADCQATQPGEPAWTCENGKRCSATADCGSDWYCQQGCCMPVVL